MRIVIDTERCQGHGACYTVAPDLFTDDERGYGTVIGDGSFGKDQVEAAERARDRCPERAITIEA